MTSQYTFVQYATSYQVLPMFVLPSNRFTISMEHQQPAKPNIPIHSSVVLPKFKETDDGKLQSMRILEELGRRAHRPLVSSTVPFSYNTEITEEEALENRKNLPAEADH